MNEVVKSENSLQIKDISIWTIFSIAVYRGLVFLELNLLVSYLLLPGIIIYSFLIYTLLKTRRFLNFWNFFFSIVIISSIFHLTSFTLLRFVRLVYVEDNVLRSFVFFFVSIIVSSILYSISYLIKRIFKA